MGGEGASRRRLNARHATSLFRPKTVPAIRPRPFATPPIGRRDLDPGGETRRLYWVVMPAAFRRLLPYMLRYRREFLLGLACTLGTTAVSLFSPWILKLAVDDLATAVTRGKLAAYAGALLGIALVAGVLRFLMRRILVGTSRHIELDIRNDFFAHLQRLPLSYFQGRRTGDLMSRATNDLNAVRMMIGPAVMYSVGTGALFVVAILMMISLNARLTFYALLALPLVSISVSRFGRAIHQRSERIQAQLSDISAIVQEALAGVRVVRAYGQEGAELARFERANAEYVRRNRQLIVLQGLFYPSMTFFLGIGALVVLWLGSREVILGRMTLGDFVAFNAYLAMLSWPMIAFGWVTNLLQRGLASWERMLEILDAPPQADPATRATDGSPAMSAAPAPAAAPALAPAPAMTATRGIAATATGAAARGAVTVRGLTFRFGDREVLHDVSFSVASGQTVAIVGPTGSGKSTLLSVLPRLHEPPRGTVFIDGEDVCDLPLAALRAWIAVVPQEPFLFSATLAENIAFGWRGPTASPGEDAIGRAAAVARLDKDLDAFPRGFDTVVGERGITLSGGQKQRTAIARAVIADPRILILDDALSAVDTYTEEEILVRLREVLRDRTALIVSHRVSTVRDADLILVLEGGRLTERGTHDELVRRGGFYADLYRRQLLEEELAAS
jgi:ATP-binding cassette, subfamily B, multidrug efflux pump